MKKLLSIIAAIGLTATSATTLVACSSSKESTDNNHIEDNSSIDLNKLQLKLQSEINSLSFEDARHYLNEYKDDQVNKLNITVLEDGLTILVKVNPNKGYYAKDLIILKVKSSPIDVTSLQIKLQGLIKDKTKEEAVKVLNDYNDQNVESLSVKVLEDDVTIIVKVTPKEGYTINEFIDLKLTSNSSSIDVTKLKEKLQSIIDASATPSEAKQKLNEYKDDQVKKLEFKILDDNKTIVAKVSEVQENVKPINEFIILKLKLIPIDIAKMQSIFEKETNGKDLELTIQFLNSYNSDQVESLKIKKLDDNATIVVTVVPKIGYSVDGYIILRVTQKEINLELLKNTLQNKIANLDINQAKNELLKFNGEEVKRLEINVLDDEKTIVVTVIPNDGYYANGIIVLELAAKLINMDELKTTLQNGIKNKSREDVKTYLMQFESEEVAAIKFIDDVTSLDIDLTIIPNDNYYIDSNTSNGHIQLVLSVIELDMDQLKEKLTSLINGLGVDDAVNYLNNYYDYQIHKIMATINTAGDIEVKIWTNVQYKISGSDEFILEMSNISKIKLEKFYYESGDWKLRINSKDYGSFFVGTKNIDFVYKEDGSKGTMEGVFIETGSDDLLFIVISTPNLRFDETKDMKITIWLTDTYSLSIDYEANS